jgi:putative N-acetyltransferase (TIGR04045 family)
VILEPVAPFRSRDVTFKAAIEPWELHAYRQLRRRIFCDEQGIFEKDDADAIDALATALVAMSNVAGMPDGVVGVVRVWEQEPGEWWGGRLGTDPVHRGDRSIAPGLIRLAVETACWHGCQRFRATVQVGNVALFERMRWHTLEELRVFGRPHALMEADLSHYRARPSSSQRPSSSVPTCPAPLATGRAA